MTPATAASATPPGRRDPGAIARSLFQLTKPRIIELLLPGCEFIGVRRDKLHSVDGYF